MKPLNVRFSDDTKQQLRDLSIKLDMTFSDTAREALSMGMAYLNCEHEMHGVKTEVNSEQTEDQLDLLK